jgi:FMN phosphatase YigB (HAD superfamily)
MPYCKPQPEALAIALRLAGNPNPRECLMVDDSPGNLLMAAQAGIYTVRAGSSQPPNGWDANIERLTDLPGVLAAIKA